MCYHPHPKNDVRCFLCLLSNDSVKGREEKGGFFGNIHQKKRACSAGIGQNVRKGVLAEAGTSLCHGNKAPRHTPPPSGKAFRLFRPMLHGELLGKNQLPTRFLPARGALPQEAPVSEDIWDVWLPAAGRRQCPTARGSSGRTAPASCRGAALRPDGRPS